MLQISIIMPEAMASGRGWRFCQIGHFSTSLGLFWDEVYGVKWVVGQDLGWLIVNWACLKITKNYSTLKIYSGTVSICNSAQPFKWH